MNWIYCTSTCDPHLLTTVILPRSSEARVCSKFLLSRGTPCLIHFRITLFIQTDCHLIKKLFSDTKSIDGFSKNRIEFISTPLLIIDEALIPHLIYY